MIRIKNSNRSIVFLLFIFVAIMSISIGYCNITDIDLNIEGTAEAIAGNNLYIDSVELADDSTSGSFEEYKTEGTLLQIISLTLPNENVTEETGVTVNVKINNLSDLSYTFSGISYLYADDLPEDSSFSSELNSNENIKIDSSYESYIGTEIDGNSVDGVGTITIPVKFKYVDISNIENNKLNISIKFNFTPIEQKTYILKSGKDFYDVLKNKYSTATQITFCAKSEVPKNAAEIGNVGTTDDEIKAYYNDTTVYIAAATKNATIQFNEDSGYMLSNGNKNKEAFAKVTDINISNGVKIDTSNTKKFEEMFKGCTSLTTSGISSFLSKFDTSNATNMCAMFGDTKSLTRLDLTNFATPNVTDMSWMFENDSSLTEIIFGDDFSTISVTGSLENQGLAAMFTGCSSLKTLDLTMFDTQNVASMWFLFQNCSNLEKIYVSDKFVTTGLKISDTQNYRNNLFIGCDKLAGEKGTTFATSKVTNYTYAHIDGGTDNPGYFSTITEYTVTLDSNGGSFESGESVKTYTSPNKVDVELNIEPVYESKYFAGWSEDKNAKKPQYYSGDTITYTKDVTLYAVWDEKISIKLKTGKEVFSAISTYKSEVEHILFTTEDQVTSGSTVVASNISVSKTGYIALYYNEKEKTIYFAVKNSDYRIQFNEDSSYMFSNAKVQSDALYNLKTIVADVDIDTSMVKNFAEIFKYDIALTQDSIQAFINKFDTSSATNMCAMFEYLTISTIDISNFNTTNVTDMSWMFHGTKMSDINFGSNFNTKNVTNFDGMFQSMSNMISLDISVFKINSKATINYMFGLNPNLKRVYVSENSGFDSIGKGLRTFENDKSIIGGIGDNRTVYSSSQDSGEYARINTTDNPGYLTNISDKETAEAENAFIDPVGETDEINNTTTENTTENENEDTNTTESSSTIIKNSVK